jgi:hypothetical protein
VSAPSAPERASNVTGNRKILKPKLLLGEGKDEVAFFDAMLKHLGKDDTQVLDYGGKSKLKPILAQLPLDPKWPEVEALLITRDADFPRESDRRSAVRLAWDEVTGALRSANLPVPRAHGEMTAAVDSSVRSTPRLGVFLLPDGVNNGMLEDLCLAAVADDAATPCLDAYFHCLAAKGVTPPRNLLPKARAHAYLASRPVPDKRVGEAAIAGYWPWSAPAFAPLLDFVRSA